MEITAGPEYVIEAYEKLYKTLGIKENTEGLDPNEFIFSKIAGFLIDRDYTADLEISAEEALEMEFEESSHPDAINLRKVKNILKKSRKERLIIACALLVHEIEYFESIGE